MSESKDYLKNYIPFEKLDNQKAKEALMEIMHAKVEQIRRYSDSVVRELQKYGVLISIETKADWSSKGLDLCIHFDVIAIRSEIIRDLEIKAIKYQKMKKIDDIDLRDLNSEDDS